MNTMWSCAIVLTALNDYRRSTNSARSSENCPRQARRDAERYQSIVDTIVQWNRLAPSGPITVGKVKTHD